MIILYIVLAIITIVFIPFSYFAVREYRRWKPIKKEVGAIRTAQFYSVLEAVSDIGDIEAEAAMLIGVEGQNDEAKYSISIPEFVANNWSGFSIEFTPTGDLPIYLTSGNKKSQLGSKEFVPVRIPRVSVKNGKRQNIWSCNRYLQKSNELKKLFTNIPIEYQGEALELFLGQTIRLGGGLEWVQGAEYPRCIVCNKKMVFIAQVSGTWFPKTVDFDIHESEIYIFGCVKHHENIQKVVQFY